MQPGNMIPLDVSELGPRQAKAVKKALSDFNWEAKAQVEINGVVGGEERRNTIIELCGSPREDAAPLLAEHLEKFGGKATKDTYRAIVGTVESCIDQLKRSRPEKDRRISQEQQAERVAAMEESGRERNC